MGKAAKSAVFVVSLGTLIGLATVAYAFFDRLSETHSGVHARALEESEPPLMSCADANDVPRAEPMWCADPSSPQCMPAAPAGQAPDLWHGSAPVMATGVPGLPPLQRRLATVSTWSRTDAEDAPRSCDRARLERPPRA